MDELKWSDVVDGVPVYECFTGKGYVELRRSSLSGSKKPWIYLGLKRVPLNGVGGLFTSPAGALIHELRSICSGNRAKVDKIYGRPKQNYDELIKDVSILIAWFTAYQEKTPAGKLGG
jgi:hypothetical protein